MVKRILQILRPSSMTSEEYYNRHIRPKPTTKDFPGWVMAMIMVALWVAAELAQQAPFILLWGTTP